MNARVIPAIHGVWKWMLAEYQVLCVHYVDGTNPDFQSINTKITIPSYYEMNGDLDGNNAVYANEGSKPIAFFTATKEKAMFRTLDYEPRLGTVYKVTADPVLDPNNNVVDGDMWETNSTYFLRHDGQWIPGEFYWLRTGSVYNNTHVGVVTKAGWATVSYNKGGRYGILPCISI